MRALAVPPLFRRLAPTTHGGAAARRDPARSSSLSLATCRVEQGRMSRWSCAEGRARAARKNVLRSRQAGCDIAISAEGSHRGRPLYIGGLVTFGQTTPDTLDWRRIIPRAVDTRRGEA